MPASPWLRSSWLASAALALLSCSSESAPKDEDTAASEPRIELTSCEPLAEHYIQLFKKKLLDDGVSPDGLLRQQASMSKLKSKARSDCRAKPPRRVDYECLMAAKAMPEWDTCIRAIPRDK